MKPFLFEKRLKAVYCSFRINILLFNKTNENLLFSLMGYGHV